MEPNLLGQDALEKRRERNRILSLRYHYAHKHDPAYRAKACAKANAWREANRERCLAGKKKWAQDNRERKAAMDRAYRLANPEKVRANGKAWRKKHALKLKEQQRARQRTNSEAISAYQKQYQKDNAERIKQKAKEWRKANPETVSKGKRLYLERHPERREKTEKSRYQKNKTIIIKKNNRRSTERMKTDPVFNLSSKLRWRTNRIVKYGLKGGNMRPKTLELLGCSFSEFKSYLEKLFQPGMTWEKFLKAQIHLDHIRPVSSFDLRDVEQIRKCFHYSNHQPLWAIENIKKGCKWKPDLRASAA